ncbi:MAG: hypothetical protein WCW47_01980 [Candidatus Paceibacterota bacterium]|jgi:hypothetical protein
MGTTTSPILTSITISDWVLIFTTILLASVAFIAPYVIERWKYTFYSAKLRFRFNHFPPDCHKTEMRGTGISYPVYYFRFRIENIGKIQAEQCEAVLERIWKENSAGDLKEWAGFSPVSLKWSGTADSKYFTVQPGREFFCDIGHISQPSHEPESIYYAIKEEQKQQNKFFFELPTRHYSQWDCLIPGKYQVQISMYSKNAKKVSKKFGIVWSGVWKNEELEMLNELVIS